MYSDYISSSERHVQLFEVTLVALCSSHYLNFKIITSEVNEYKLRACSSDRHDSASDRHELILQEDSLLRNEHVECFMEFVNSMSALKLMRVWVLSRISD